MREGGRAGERVGRERERGERSSSKRARHADQATPPVAEFGRQAICQAGKVHHVENLIHAVSCLRCASTGCDNVDEQGVPGGPFGCGEQVVAHREIFKQFKRLKSTRETRSCTGARTGPRDISTVEGDRPFRCGGITGDCINECGLACSVWADKAHKCPFGTVEIDRIVRAHAAVGHGYATRLK